VEFPLNATQRNRTKTTIDEASDRPLTLRHL